MTLRTWPRLASSLLRWTRSVRGDIYQLKASKYSRGHEQAGARYAVVLQSEDLPLSTYLIAPTSTSCRPASFRPEVEIGGVKTRVMVEQLNVVDPQIRFGNFAGRLDRDELLQIDAALLLVLGLD